MQHDKLDTEKLNLDGTHALVKKSAETSGYQVRKKGKTSSVLIMTDGRGIPVATGNILPDSHNGLYGTAPQFAAMIKELNSKNICVENSLLNADKGFDCKGLAGAMMRRRIIPDIKENSRNRKARQKAFL